MYENDDATGDKPLTARTLRIVLGAVLALCGILQAVLAESTFQLVIGIGIALCGVGQVVAAVLERRRADADDGAPSRH